MNQELKELREEIFEDNMMSMKDLGNVSGGIGNRLVELEKKVEEMLKEHGKTPKIERRVRHISKLSRIPSLCSVFLCKTSFIYYVCVIMNFMSI